MKSDGTLASPFCLPAGKAYMSPALPRTSQHFHFSLDLSPVDFPPCVFGVARKSSIRALAAKLHHFNDSLAGADFKGAGVMLVPTEEDEGEISLAVAPLDGTDADISPARAAQSSSTEVRKIFVHDRLTIAGSARRREVAGDGSCEYVLEDLLLNGRAEPLSSFEAITTPRVGPGVTMHVFIAAWDAAKRLHIMAESPPLAERVD